jgi:hypothetical protein
MTGSVLENYFRRFGFCGRQIDDPPHPDLGIVIVVPCFNEPDLVATLESLWMAERPDCALEVIVVVNSPEDAPEHVLERNRISIEEARAWMTGRCDRRFRVQLIHFPALPRRIAGVGLARKIGMDEALRRLGEVGRMEGLIAGFDADCTCDRGYLVEIRRYFQTHPECPASGIYFEHPLEGPLDPRVYKAIAGYELHLRYLVRALRYTGSPFAHHTLGSCMAVRAGIYALQGGMNKRRAGEDFYFLQKMIALGNFGAVSRTRVIPSPRASNRVPFGTGKAVTNRMERYHPVTYPWPAFVDLRKFFECVLNGPAAGTIPAGVPESLEAFLEARRFREVLEEIRGNVSGAASFRKRFFRWFNGFMAMKYLNHARDRCYGAADLGDESKKLLSVIAPERTVSPGAGLRELLMIYRAIERED